MRRQKKMLLKLTTSAAAMMLIYCGVTTPVKAATISFDSDPKLDGMQVKAVVRQSGKVICSGGKELGLEHAFESVDCPQLDSLANYNGLTVSVSRNIVKAGNNFQAFSKCDNVSFKYEKDKTLAIKLPADPNTAACTVTLE
jgi:hypothetical protein